MKTTRRLLLALLLPLTVATLPAHAGLIIQDLSISVLAQVSNLPPVTQFSVGTGLPGLLTATAETSTERAFAMQTKNGFFQNYVSSDGATAIVRRAGTGFHLVVGTDTPDTPLILDFDFLGAQAIGAAYYGAGDMQVGIRQTIVAGFNGAVSTAWGFADSLKLNTTLPSPIPGWNRIRYIQIDTQGIGLPTETLTVANYVNSFTESLSLVLDPFHGQLDFGMLQPGQTFTLDYESESEIGGSLTYPFSESGAVASLVDPFSLGGTPPPQLALRGLTLPSLGASSSAPEPGTFALLALGSLPIVRMAVRRRRI